MSDRYVTTADTCGLEEGTFFVVLPPAEVQEGNLVLFTLAGVPQIGEWISDGCILVSDKLIRIVDTPNVNYQFIGPVVVVDEENVYTCLN